MSEKLKLGKYEFYPYDVESGKKTPEEVSDDLEKLLEKVKKRNTRKKSKKDKKFEVEKKRKIEQKK